MFCALNCPHRHFLRSLLLKCKAFNWPPWQKGRHLHFVECHLYANYQRASQSFCCVEFRAAWRPTPGFLPDLTPLLWPETLIWHLLNCFVQYDTFFFSFLLNVQPGGVNIYETRDLLSRSLQCSCWDRTYPGWNKEIITAMHNWVLNYALGFAIGHLGSEEGKQHGPCEEGREATFGKIWVGRSEKGGGSKESQRAKVW